MIWKSETGPTIVKVQVSNDDDKSVVRALC